MTLLTCFPNEQLRAQGRAILRVHADLRDFLAESEDVPESLLRDLDQVERAGQWLVSASSIPLIPSATGSGGNACGTAAGAAA